jgi:hypothetical protein
MREDDRVGVLSRVLELAVGHGCKPRYGQNRYAPDLAAR